MNVSLQRISFIAFLIFTTQSFTKEVTYVSQNGQDMFFHGIFINTPTGTYVEVGANNGIKFNNTYIFEQLGWRGMCIEPIPKVFNELCQNRNCICIQGCVADFNGQAQFLHIDGKSEMCSGLTQKYDPRHIHRIQCEVFVNKDNVEFLTVDCYKLNDLLTSHGFFHIDLLTLDTEGGEFDILKSIDFDTFDIDIICVEDNYNFKDCMCSYLEKYNFVLITSIGADLIFRNRKYLNQ